jgi:hypothetical protein
MSKGELLVICLLIFVGNTGGLLSQIGLPRGDVDDKDSSSY